MTPDPLDELMKQSNPYLDDAGFTARVMAKLPPPRPATGRVRAWVLSGAAALAAVAAALGQVHAHATGPLEWQSLGAFALTAAVIAATGLSVLQREAER